MYSADSTIMRKLLGRGSSTAVNETAATAAATSAVTEAAASATQQQQPAQFDNPLAFMAGPNTASGISNQVPTTAAGTQQQLLQQHQQQQLPPQQKRSRNASYSAAAPILSLDASPDGRHLVLGGRHILRTVTAMGSAFSEDVDLRAIITSQKGGKASGISDQLSIQDVKWQNDHSLFTACASGKIFYYDLAQARGGSVAPLTIQNNTRQVTTLDVNPHHRLWLISGSQDGTVRNWDMRTNPRSNNITFNARQSFQAHSESIRCVRWSPRDGFMFACSTDNGMVFYGDIRMPKFRMRISAHEGACSSISWHPDGVHLLTGGIDQKLHVWDMTSTEKRRKPEWAIHTPAPVGQALWRPSLWSAADQGRRAAQIAVAYDANSQRRHGRSMVHIWDLARPTMPFKVLEQFSSTPTGLLWRDQDVLWAVGQDGELNQCDLALAPRVIDRRAMSTFAFSPTGDAMMFLDKRPSVPRHHHVYFEQSAADAYNMHKHNLGAQTPSISMASSPQGLSLAAARSYSDEDLTGTFLNQRRPLSSQKHDGGSSSSQAHMNPGRPESCPPVIAPHQDDSAMPLAKSMEASGMFCMTQSMAASVVPFRADPAMYKYLTFHYLTILQKLLPRDSERAKPLPQRVGRILEKYGQVAEDAGLFRLAQSWRILGHVTQILLLSRGQFHLQLRMGQLRRAVSKGQLNSSNTPVRRAQIAEPAVRDMFPPPRKAHEGSTGPAHSLLAEEFENTSNMATPRALAVPDNKTLDYSAGATPLSPVLEAPSSFALPPALRHPPLSSSPRVRHNSQPLSTGSRHSSDTQASTDGYDFYDAAAFTKAIDVPGAEKSDPFTHEFGSRTPGSVAGAYSTPGNMASSGSYSQSHPGNLLSTSMSSHNAESEDHDGDSEYHGGTDSREMRRSKQVFDLHDGDGDNDSELPEDVYVVGKTTAGDSRRLRSVPSRGQNFGASMSGAGTAKMARQPAVAAAETTTTTIVAAPAATAATTTTAATTAATVRASPHVSFLAKQLEPTALEKAQTSDSLSVGEYDYFLWHDDPPFPFPSAGAATDYDGTPPIDPYAIIQQTLEFECRKSAVNAAAMVLLLRPLVPDSVISKFQAEAILKQHHSRLMNMKCFIEAAQLRNLCTENWVAGLPCWGESYPSIFGTAQHDVQVSFACPFCRKPREISPHAGADAIWACERCQRTMAACAVCHHRHVVADLLNQIKKDTPAGADPHEPVLTGWWYCRGCGHGGHANCLQAWHYPLVHNGHVDEFSNGLCPMDGCGHECLPTACTEEPPKMPGGAMAMAMSSSSSSFSALDKMFAGGIGGGMPSTPLATGTGAGSFSSLARTSQLNSGSFGEGTARVRADGDAGMVEGLRDTAAAAAAVERSQPMAVAEKRRSAGGRGGRRRDRN